ncbi:MAG: cysteine synthase family protein [Chloroflexota bacterium]
MNTQAKTIIEQIGNTPLLNISSLAHEQGVPPDVNVYAKAEWANPSGSVKARAALYIIEDAERRGVLTHDKVLIDSSSGNTGIAYAMIGAAKGYDVHLVMPGNVSSERKVLSRAYGATVIESDPLEGSDGAILKVRELVEAEPERYFYADQYSNDANWRAHFETTGPEIWNQTTGTITHFIAGLGTTGTFIGTSRYLRTQNPDVQLISMQPEDELAVIEGLKHLETAIVPGIYDEKVADRDLRVGVEDTFDMIQLAGRKYGLFLGPSAAAAVAGAINIAKEIERGTVVTILPDDGSKYVSLGLYG